MKKLFILVILLHFFNNLLQAQSPPSITIVVSNDSICPGAPVTFTATTANSGTTPTYQWKRNGLNIVGATSVQYSTSSIDSGDVFTCSFTSFVGLFTQFTAQSNVISMFVFNPVNPTVSIATSEDTICTGTAVTFTATPSSAGINPFFTWKLNGNPVGTNSAVYTTSTLNDSDQVVLTITTNPNCPNPISANSNSITERVAPNIHPSVSIVASKTTICPGEPVSFNATATNASFYQWKINGNTVGTNSSTYHSTGINHNDMITCTVTALKACNATIVVGDSSGQNHPESSYGSFYPTIGKCGKLQYLIKANELTTKLAAGEINSIGVKVGSVQGNPAYMSNYLIMMGHTLLTELEEDFEYIPFAGLVYGPQTYTPTLNAVNHMVFQNPFSWNGINNITILFCFENSINGQYSYVNNVSTTAFSCGVRITGFSTSTGCCNAQTGFNGSVYERPVFYINGKSKGTAVSNSITVQVPNKTPSITITPPLVNLCMNGSQTFTSSNSHATDKSFQWNYNGNNVGTNNSVLNLSNINTTGSVNCTMTFQPACPLSETLGAGTNQNILNDGAFFPTNNGNGRQQYLIRATELQALGYSAGNIRRLSVLVGSVVGDPAILNDYTIKIATTTNSVMTASLVNTGFTTVFGPTNFTPTINSYNTLVFTTPFYWDGTNNLIIDVCFSNQVTGSVAYRNTYTNPGFTASAFYQANGIAGANACAATSGNLTTRRPNFIFGITPVMDLISNSSNVVVTPFVTPSINISANNTTVCDNEMVNFTASISYGGASPTFQWKVNGIQVGTNSTSFSTSSLNNGDVVTCKLISNYPCINPPSSVTSNPITITIDPCLATVNATAFIEGYYLGSNQLSKVLYNQGIESNPSTTNCDSITLELHQSVSPYTLVHSCDGLLQTNGNIVCQFPHSAIGQNYYLVLRHRNSIETWSANPILISSNTTYDFTTNANKAFGDNQVEVEPNEWAFYSGDMNQDQVVDAFDYILLDPDVINGSTGYHTTDLTGDGVVDAFDYIILDANLILGINAITP
jgi:hypothetical protein